MILFTLLAIIVTLVANFIIYVGIAAFLALVTWMVVLALRDLFQRIQRYLRTRVGGKVALVAAAPVLKGVKGEIQRKGNVHNVDKLIAQLDEMDKNDGVFVIKDPDNVKEENIEIIQGRKGADANFKKFMEQNEGMAILQ